MFAWQITSGPQPIGDSLQLLSVCGLGHEHDERWQILIHGAQTVGNPRSKARLAGDLVAGLHEGNGRFVVDGFGVHRAHEAQIVRHFAVHGSNSEIHMPFLPYCANLYFEGAMGRRFCPLVIVVIRWPMRTESGKSLSNHSSKLGL